jgi:hypothetical protein
MKQGRLSELGLKEGDVVICEAVHEEYKSWTAGKEYKVMGWAGLSLIDDEGDVRSITYQDKNIFTNIGGNYKMKQGLLSELDLKEGDVVICVDDNDYPEYWTIGEEYVVMSAEFESLYVVDDDGDERPLSQTWADRNIFKVTTPSLRMVKISLLKHNGNVNVELSKAFQEAVFESGGEWGSGEREVKHLDTLYMFVDGDGVITFTDFGEHFKNQTEFQEITFDYEYTLSYTVKAKEDSVLNELKAGVDKLTKELKLANEALNAYISKGE